MYLGAIGRWRISAQATTHASKSVGQPGGGTGSRHHAPTADLAYPLIKCRVDRYLYCRWCLWASMIALRRSSSSSSSPCSGSGTPTSTHQRPMNATTRWLTSNTGPSLAYPSSPRCSHEPKSRRANRERHTPLCQLLLLGSLSERPTTPCRIFSPELSWISSICFTGQSSPPARRPC